MAVSVHTANGVKPKSGELTWNPVRFSLFSVFCSCSFLAVKSRDNTGQLLSLMKYQTHTKSSRISVTFIMVLLPKPHFDRVSDERQMILTETCPELGCVHNKCDAAFLILFQSGLLVAQLQRSPTYPAATFAADLCGTLS